VKEGDESTPETCFSTVYNSFKEEIEDFRNFIIEFHQSIISAYCVTDVRYLMEWDSHRKFQNDLRCSYGIQMWDFYMKSVCKDMFNNISYHYSCELFSELVSNSAKLWSATYCNIFPSTKRKMAQLRGDVTYLVMYLRSFRDVVDSKTEKLLNKECLKMLVVMSIICAPLDVLKTFAESLNKKETNIQAAKFAILYQQSKSLKYIKGIPMVVWNSCRFYPVSDFSPIREYNRVGNSGANEIEFPEIKNASFDFLMLLNGYNICGITLGDIFQHVQLRCEFNDNDYPAPTEDEKALRQEVTSILSSIL